MNGDHGLPAGRGGAPATPRWNPTKEQISMLENLYGEGVRTPNAEQIEEITSRLKAYGDIECKNVFYWFQNHKARQRQKQKQENLAIFNHYLLHNPSAFPPHPSVVCSPYYMPQSNSGLYPRVLIPNAMKKRPRAEKNVKKPKMQLGGAGYEPAHSSTSQHDNRSNQETLALFPQHPTGILQGRISTSSSPSNSSDKLII